MWIPTTQENVAGGNISAWADYTPTLTASSVNPNLGSSPTTFGRWMQIGDLVVVHLLVGFGSSGSAAGSGTYEISVPVTGSASDVNYVAVGSGRLYDSSANLRKLVSAMWANASRDKINLVSEAASSDVSDAVPFIWSNSDRIDLVLQYEVA